MLPFRSARSLASNDISTTTTTARQIYEIAEAQTQRAYTHETNGYELQLSFFTHDVAFEDPPCALKQTTRPKGIRESHSVSLKSATVTMLLLASISTMFVLYQDAQNLRSAPKTIPLIVAWTPYFSSTLKKKFSPTLKNCKYQCEFIDREEQKIWNRSAAAYVMHARDIVLSDLPNQTSPHLNIMFLLESPFNSGSQIHRLPKNYFNATITYRRDSRYFSPYGHFVPLTPAESKWTIPEKKLMEIIRKKKRGSLIFVSNCHTSSKRENHIRELGQFTEITVRGGCQQLLVTNKSLPSLPCKPECSDKELIETHRFYISYENSLCNDYITEKFFMRASQLLVPVVMKRRFYEGTTIPNNSFIALDDFQNAQQLGDYLNYLRNNDTAYMKYFEWRQHYKDPTKYQSRVLCELCEDIYNGEKLTIENIKDYYEKNQCI